MKRYCLIPGLLVLLVPQQAQAQAAILGKLAQGTATDLVAQTIGNALTDLGVFSALGLGSNPDVEINRKLDQIENQLQQIHADIASLSSDFSNVETQLQVFYTETQFWNAYGGLESKKNNILDCADDIKAFAQGGDDASDQYMFQYAQEIAGVPSTTTSPCNDVIQNFEDIDDAIVGDSTVPGFSSGLYTTLGRLMAEEQQSQAAQGSAGQTPVNFQTFANHFIQYSLVQHQALQLIRNAFSVLGQKDALQAALTSGNHDFLNRLRREEVAFLKGTDAFIATGVPTHYDPSQAALADAIVQRLEGVPAEVTSYSLSILDYGPWTPTLFDSQLARQEMSDTVGDGVSTYYNAADSTVTADVGDCVSPGGPTDFGFAFVRPNGLGAGFNVSSSCTVHVARHANLNASLPSGMTSWYLAGGRYASPSADVTELPFKRRNAATLADEADADAYALAGDPAGQGSGASAFNVIADHHDPNVISFTIDLPNQAGTPVRVGTSHPLLATGSGDIAKFTRVPAGPAYPDRYALTANGQYLSVDTNGFATLGTTKEWFDFRLRPDGRTELDYDGGVLYVDVQSLQAFFSEAPDTYLVNDVNLAQRQSDWSAPNDPAIQDSVSSLNLLPPCLDGNGNPVTTATTHCNSFGGTGVYQTYRALITNEDNAPRTYQVSTSSALSYATYATISGIPLSREWGGVRCYSSGMSPIDSGVGSLNPGDAFETGVATTTFTLPAKSSINIDCISSDSPDPSPFNGAYPAGNIIDNFTIQPCKPSSGATCLTY
jgi:hypothetical protein